MLIGGVDLPEGLINAQRDGHLVVFAGAGVSMGAPSNLPDFPTLASLVGDRVSPREVNEQIDRYFGRLEDLGVDIQNLTRRIISDPASVPRPLHSDLIRLFAAASTVRIVTTNFDTHFSTTAQSVFTEVVETYFAPALPLGREFSGIVYLHGSVTRPQPLVLSDKDLGRAYVTDAWATRFLTELFERFVVLFVGYSHEDPLMRYLARSLLPRTTRYVITPTDDGAKWKELGIRPVYFTAGAGEAKYAPLDEAIRAWAQAANMGALDHENRVRELAKAAPPIGQEDADYVAAALGDDVRRRFFVEHVSGLEWLRWVDSRHFLDGLFTEEIRPGESQRVLAHWFANRFVIDYPVQALDLVAAHGGALNPHLWFSLVLRLLRDPLPGADVLARWVVVLGANRIPDNGGDFLGQLLGTCTTEGHAPAGLLLLAMLSNPRQTLEKRWISEGDRPQLHIAIRLSADRHVLQEAWEKCSLREPGKHTSHLLALMTSAITLAQLLERGAVDGSFESTSYRRSAIEAHAQDAFGESFDFVIDVARSALEDALVRHPPLARSVIALWLASGPRLLKRLAIHGMCEDPELAPNEALQRIVDGKLLYDFGLKHEVFRLLESRFGAASQRSQEALLEFSVTAEVMPGIQDGPEARETADYERYNLAVWLVHVAPKSAVAAEHLRRMQATHPKFAPRDHPDLDHWSSGAQWGGAASPVTMSELTAKPPREQLPLLLTYKQTPGDFGGPDRPGLLETLASAATQNFDWGLELSLLLPKSDAIPTDVWRALLRGWRTGPLTPDQWSKVLQLASECVAVLAAAVPDALAQLLAKAAEAESGALSGDALGRLEGLALALVRSVHSADGIVPGQGRADWLTVAINHPVGDLTITLLRTLTKRRSSAGDAWTGIPGSYRSAFEFLIQDESVDSSRGRIVLASQLHFLFAIDRDWTARLVIPLFDWSRNRLQAQQAWHGFLGWGRWNDSLLNELLPHFRGSFARLGDDLSEVRDQFADRAVGLALYSELDPWRGGWLEVFVRDADEASRRAWASRMVYELINLKQESVRLAWARWLKDYWSDRVRGLPRPLTGDERSEMLEWTISLETVFREAVEIAVQMPTQLREHSLFFHRLREAKGILSRHQHETANLLLHVLAVADTLGYSCVDVGEIFKALVAAGGTRAELAPIANHMARLGCPNARDLLALLGD